MAIYCEECLEEDYITGVSGFSQNLFEVIGEFQEMGSTCAIVQGTLGRYGENHTPKRRSWLHDDSIVLQNADIKQIFG